MKITGLVLVAATLAGTGCSKSSAHADRDEDAWPIAFAAWMPVGAERAWQGAWASRLTLRPTGPTTLAGDPTALDIRGTRATSFDGKTEQALGFEVVAPCEAQFTQAIDDGSMKGTAYYGVHYLLAGESLRVGRGAAGYRRGKAAIVCGRGIHVLDASGACTTWEKLATWRQRPETCTWSHEDGKDVLTIGAGEWALEVVADGDLLADEQFRHDVSEGYHRAATDFSAAKRDVVAQVQAGAR